MENDLLFLGLASLFIALMMYAHRCLLIKQGYRIFRYMITRIHEEGSSSHPSRSHLGLGGVIGLLVISVISGLTAFLVAWCTTPTSSGGFNYWNLLGLLVPLFFLFIWFLFKVSENMDTEGFRFIAGLLLPLVALAIMGFAMVAQWNYLEAKWRPVYENTPPSAVKEIFVDNNCSGTVKIICADGGEYSLSDSQQKKELFRLFSNGQEIFGPALGGFNADACSQIGLKAKWPRDSHRKSGIIFSAAEP